MTDLHKFRELKLKCRQGHIFIHGEEHLGVEKIHVIEYSAVEAMQAEIDELNYALKFQTNSLDREMNMTEKLQIENNSLKQALDLAVCGILAIKDYTSLHEQRKEKWDVQYIYAIEQKINEALTAINEIINKTKQGESK